MIFYFSSRIFLSCKKKKFEGTFLVLEFNEQNLQIGINFST